MPCTPTGLRPAISPASFMAPAIMASLSANTRLWGAERVVMATCGQERVLMAVAVATAGPHLTNPQRAASSAYIFLAVSASSLTRLQEEPRTLARGSLPLMLPLLTVASFLL